MVPGRGAHGSALRAGGPDVPGLRRLQFRRHEDLRTADRTALDAGPRLDGGVDPALSASARGVLSAEYNRTEDTMVRQQLKWLRNGAFCGILPFAAFYVLPYVLGAVPNSYMKMSVLSVMLIPLTLAYAIVRYRLMDVDIIFRRGYAYTLATLCVLAGFLRHRLLAGQPGQAELQGPGQYRPDDGHADHRVPVPAHPQLDPGAAGPALLPRPLRLPPHAGGVRPRAEFGDRSGHHARHRR